MELTLKSDNAIVNSINRGDNSVRCCFNIEAGKRETRCKTWHELVTVSKCASKNRGNMRNWCEKHSHWETGRCCGIRFMSQETSPVQLVREIGMFQSRVTDCTESEELLRLFAKCVNSNHQTIFLWIVSIRFSYVLMSGKNVLLTPDTKSFEYHLCLYRGI